MLKTSSSFAARKISDSLSTRFESSCPSGTPVVTAADLSPGAKRLVDALLADWGERMHSTSIALAMTNLKIPPDDGLRLEVGPYLRDNPNIANNIKFWGANNYILSNEEKRIEKYVINTYEEGKLRQLEYVPQRTCRKNHQSSSWQFQFVWIFKPNIS
jgi:hypothetical protein